ncbi:M48 family metallopeptidase [Alkalibacter mobilis]|uniref:M48 family metallopeptidase n=1 Tax=Alkalibacter mobilis TaxID=2787712 RepID=UPI00189FD3EF|nr:SprT family zinc-dependent metalloprotease [Alkalibacter mobilis]MBF7097414.1 M48 family metallopeptidase [Alkalibacter mobilis]
MDKKKQLSIGEIEYNVVKRKRKTAEIKIDSKGVITLTVPHHIDDARINKMISDKIHWIINKKSLIVEKNRKIKPVNFQQGDQLNFLGNKYTLNICGVKSNKSRIDFVEEKIVFEGPICDRKIIKDELVKWYKIQGREIISSRVGFYSKYFDHIPTEIKVKEQKKRWGSCTYDNKLLFNWRIIMAPMEIIDYIVVHEMSHMKHKNHSRDFWCEVNRVYPEYKNCKDWLKENYMELSFNDDII